jgi:hypothetical protein
MSVNFLITVGVTIFCRSWNYSLSVIVLNVSVWSELCVHADGHFIGTLAFAVEKSEQKYSYV